MTPKSVQAARHLLGKLKVNSLPIPVEQLAKAAGAKVSHRVLEGEVSGLLYNKGGKSVIGVNSLHPKTRQRFTIAHELGHLVLQHGDILVDKHILYRNSRSQEGIDQIEIEANSFAAELLMPELMIRRELTQTHLDPEDQDALEALAGKFDVSVPALTFRLVNLGLMSANWSEE